MDGDNIRSIIQDRYGWLWVGTQLGLKRFDGKKFHGYKHDPGDPNSLISNNINVLHEDRNGKIWVGTSNGLDCYDPAREEFHHYYHREYDPESLSNERIRCILEDSHNNLWVGTSNGLNRLNRETDSFDQYFFKRPGSNNLRDSEIHAILEGDSGVLWIGTNEGLIRFDPVTEKFERFRHDPENPRSLSTNVVECLYQDRQGYIWVGLRRRGGLNRFHPHTGQVDRFQPEPDERAGVTLLFEDQAGRLWVGTNLNRKMYIFDEASSQFTLQFSGPQEQGEPYKEISAFFQDREGTYWIGHGDGLYSFASEKLEQPYQLYSPSTDPSVTTFGTAYKDSHGIFWLSTSEGLHQFDPATKAYRTLLSASRDNLKNRIINILEDQYQDMWFGAADGLKRFDRKTQQFHHYDPDLRDPTCRPCHGIRSMYEDQKGRLWIGTLGGGLHSFDRDKDKLQLEWYNPTGALSDNAIGSIMEDEQGRLWFGCGAGLLLFDSEGYTVISMQQDAANSLNLGGKEVRTLLRDRSGNLWIGTDHALNVLQEGDEYAVKHFLEKDGLAGNAVGDILEDNYGQLWIPTDKGLSILNPTSRIFRNFYDLYGIGMPVRMLFVDRNTNEIWLAGEKIPGFMVIHPDSLPHNDYSPPVYISGLSIYDQKDPEAAFQEVKAPWSKKSITLPYRQNTFNTEFAVLSYKNPALNQAKYKLEGVHSEWIDLGSKREATFSNLRPGKYTLRLIGSNNDGVWNEEGVSLPITILPPWWLTLWAKMSYVFLAGGILYSFYQYQLKRKLEVANAHRLQELDRVKTKLFTNITHEFRTPLTVIQGLAEQGIEQEGHLSPEQNLTNLQLIRRNGAQLLTLVNQMLDLRKLESGQLPVRMVQGDVIQYLRYLIESFHSYAESKGVNLHFLCEEEALVLDYDPEKLLYIISNLLSNAIKFTPAGGNVYFSVDYAADTLKLTVKDTGVGIEADNLLHIFNRFYQVDDSPTRKGEGSGIGLALTRELVNLLQGEIEVSSKLEKGTVFAVRLPITRKAEVSLLEKTDLDNKVLGFTGPDANAFDNRYGSVHPLDPPPAGDTQPLALIIEDNPDVVRYLSSCLEADYKILTAHDGQTGIDTALDMIPDIIISDVMMPQRDGYEVCDILKNDERTSHIPIILLTAKADLDSRITGLWRGADAYLAKPFHREELQVRLAQMIELRRKLQEHYGGLLPEELTKTRSSLEADFLRRVRQTVEENLSDSDFDITRLCRAVGLSRSQLFRKLKALTGKSTTAVVRSIRLQRGRQLLMRTQLNVSEVAYEVGFRDPNYFSKCFQDEFGELPSAVRS